MTSARPARTSITDPLRIDEVSIPGYEGVIGLTLCPGKEDPWSSTGPWKRDLGLDLAAIRDWGAAMLLSLIEPDEYDRVKVADMGRRIPEGMEQLRLPIKDVSVPDKSWEEAWVREGPRVRELLRKGGRVCIHCMGGLGRSGLVAARLLVELGLPPEEAMARVRTSRKGAIETRQQEDHVRSCKPVHEHVRPARRPLRHIAPERASRFRGCLLGGAVGDALGAPVEFLGLASIKSRFGEEGIKDFAEAYGRVGAITDDTQMTLFTVEAILRAHVRSTLRGIGHFPGMAHRSYLRWLSTQGVQRPGLAQYEDGFLVRIPELRSRRAPGNTCISALESSIADPDGGPADNTSKGCGGIMRAAPAGLYVSIAEGGDGQEAGQHAFEGGEACAAVTHGHRSGQLPAGFLSDLVFRLARGAGLHEAIELALRDLLSHEGHEETLEAVLRAKELAGSGLPPDRCLPLLGEGWTAPEALAIALFCSLRASDFEEGIRLAVNITGDSDSTGSITGNILGTLWGCHEIPDRWLSELELRGLILEMADDLALLPTAPIQEYRDMPEAERREGEYWRERYPGW